MSQQLIESEPGFMYFHLGFCVFVFVYFSTSQGGAGVSQQLIESEPGFIVVMGDRWQSSARSPDYKTDTHKKDQRNTFIKAR